MKKLITLLAVAELFLALALSTTSANAALVGQLGVLDEAWFTANSTNPDTGLAWQVGDTYHLAFSTVTTVIQIASGARSPADAMWTDITNWDAVVQTEADAAGIGAGVGVTWNIIGSTSTVNARDHAFVSGAVYDMQGNPIASNYGDMWDGAVANPITHIDGTPVGSPSYANLVMTGSNSDGTKSTNPLGDTDTFCDWGNPGFSDAPGNFPQWMRHQHPRQDMNRPGSIYGLSEPLTVGGEITAPAGGYPASYRLMFITNTKTTAESADIGTYNTFVSAEAAADTEVNALGATWTAVGSTVTVDARDNTSTAGTGGVNDVPIYDVNGNLLAANNAALWGAPALLVALELDGTESDWGRVWTGSLADGTLSVGGDNGGLGDTAQTYTTHGDPKASQQTGTGRWIKGNTQTRSQLWPMYALSSPLTPPVWADYEKADYRWTGNGADDNWTTVANWNVNLYEVTGDTWTGFGAAEYYPGEVAPLAEQFASDPQYPSTNNPIIVNSVIPFRVANSITETGGNYGWDSGSTTTDGAIKVVTGGDIDFLTEHSNSQLGGLGSATDGRNTTVIMEGGRLRMDNSYTRANATWRLEMTGGLIDNSEGTGVSFWTFHKANAGGHDSIMNIHGGILEAENLPGNGAILASKNRLIDIQNDGLLKLHGNQLDDIQSYVNNGANVDPEKSGHIRGSNPAPGATRGGIDPAAIIEAGTGTVSDDVNSGDLRWGYDSINDLTYAWATSPDPDAPIITLKGDSEIAHEAGNVFEDPGATVADKDGNALDATKIVVAGEVKGDNAGEYVLTYDFTDATGHNAMQIKRRVTVADTLAPVITINGEKEMRIGINSQFSDPGATAKDLLDGDIEVQTTIPIAVDTTAAGDFEIIYTSTDAAGNKAEVKRLVKVLPETVPPVITLIGEANVTVNLGAAYDDKGAIAEDNIDGVLTPFIEDSGTVDAVDTSKKGTYLITYDVEDFSGNKAVQVTRTVIVKSADPFDNWLANLPAGQQSYDSDPDNDGIANLLEYAFGGDPTKTDQAIVMPTFDTSGGFLKLTFCHLKASLDPNLNYMPEISSSLKVAWSTDGLTTRGALEGVLQDNLPDGKPFATSDYTRATVTADKSMEEAGAKQFLRISVIRE
jgi:hypothetical protein